MHHAVNFIFQTDKQTEFGDVLDLARYFRADRIAAGKVFPRICHALFQAKRNTTFFAVDFQHHHFDFLRSRNDFAWVYVLFDPAHFRHMHKPFNAGAQLNKRTIIGDICDATGDAGFQREARFDIVPRIGFELFHAQADTLGFRIDLDYLHPYGLADGEHFGRMVDAPPCNVGDMQQAVNTAQIDKGTIIGDVFHHTLNGLSFDEVLHNLAAGFGACFFHNGASRHYNIAAPTIHFENLERLFGVHQRCDIAHRTNIDLTARQKGRCAVEVDREAPFDAPENDAFDTLFGSE